MSDETPPRGEGGRLRSPLRSPGAREFFENLSNRSSQHTTPQRRSSALRGSRWHAGSSSRNASIDGTTPPRRDSFCGVDGDGNGSNDGMPTRLLLHALASPTPRTPKTSVRHGDTDGGDSNENSEAETPPSSVSVSSNFVSGLLSSKVKARASRSHVDRLSHQARKFRVERIMLEDTEAEARNQIRSEEQNTFSGPILDHYRELLELLRLHQEHQEEQEERAAARAVSDVRRELSEAPSEGKSSESLGEAEDHKEERVPIPPEPSTHAALPADMELDTLPSEEADAQVREDGRGGRTSHSEAERALTYPGGSEEPEDAHREAAEAPDEFDVTQSFRIGGHDEATHRTGSLATTTVYRSHSASGQDTNPLTSSQQYRDGNQEDGHDVADNDDAFLMALQHNQGDGGRDGPLPASNGGESGEGSVYDYSRPVSAQGEGWASSAGSPLGFNHTDMPTAEEGEEGGMGGKMRQSEMKTVLATLEDNPGMAAASACEREHDSQECTTRRDDESTRTLPPAAACLTPPENSIPVTAGIPAPQPTQRAEEQPLSLASSSRGSEDDGEKEGRRVVLQVKVTNIYTAPDESCVVNPVVHHRPPLIPLDGHTDTAKLSGASLETAPATEGGDGASACHSQGEHGVVMVRRYCQPCPNYVIVCFPSPVGRLAATGHAVSLLLRRLGSCALWVGQLLCWLSLVQLLYVLLVVTADFAVASLGASQVHAAV